MKIISPSYKRAKTVKTHKLIENISYAVHEFEKEEYKKEGFDVIVLPDSTKGNIPNVRNWLLDQNFNKILLICGENSFKKSGAEKLLKNLLINSIFDSGLRETPTFFFKSLIFLIDSPKFRVASG